MSFINKFLRNWSSHIGYVVPPVTTTFPDGNVFVWDWTRDYDRL